MSAISIKQLLEAGVHFGHQTSRWNPKMKEYIFGERNGIHIIDLQQTLGLFSQAVDFMSETASQGKEILFVGTKRQAQEAIEEDARRCKMHFVTNRWLGGLLTNFSTVQNSIKRYKELESMKENGFYDKLSKKEVAQLERERKKLDKNLRGIRDMERLPDAVFIIDSEREGIAVKEANRLGIPIVAVVDTNSDPDLIDYIIPGNDDALRSVKLFTETIADAILAGRSGWEVRVAEEQRKAREKAEKEAAARAEAKAAREKARAEKQAQAEAEAQAKAEAEEKASAKSSEKAEAEEVDEEKAETASQEAPAEEEAESSGEENAEADTAEAASSQEPPKKASTKRSKKSSEKQSAEGPRKAAASKKKPAKARATEEAVENEKKEGSQSDGEEEAKESSGEDKSQVEAKAES